MNAQMKHVSNILPECALIRICWKPPRCFW